MKRRSAIPSLSIETGSHHNGDDSAEEQSRLGVAPLPLRPSRLSPVVQTVLTLLLGLSLLSGLALWYGSSLQEQELEPARWFRPALVLHGVLNPFLCALFGYMWVIHMRLGWQKKANRWSGLSVALCLGLLILSGTGLYYGSEGWHSIFSVTHRLVGVALPLVLASHWIAAFRIKS